MQYLIRRTKYRSAVTKWALACTLAGCGGTKDGADSETAETSETATGADAVCEPARTTVDDCCCFGAVADGDGIFTLTNECPLQATLCEFRVKDDNYTPVVVEPSALTCALEALRDRKAGRLLWSDNHLFGQFADADLFVQADGTVLVVQVEGTDVFPNTYLDIRRSALKPPAYFTGCLALTDDFERFGCLMGFQESVAEVCVAAFDGI